MNEPLLDIQGLTTEFVGQGEPLVAVDDLNLGLSRGEVLGLVGESGCGKSLTALSVLGLLPPPGRVSAGRVLFKGEDLLTACPERLQKIRGAEIGMIFQEPMTSLNPVFTVGRQISEMALAHGENDKHRARELAVEMLTKVGIPEAGKRVDAFPHELSGGMRQRVMIAMALSLNPALVIADEPTTALDVTIQAQILKLMDKMRTESGAAFLLITHNLAVVAQHTENVAVMYTGRLVETSPVLELFDHPLHPYTRGLMACLPDKTSPKTALMTISGTVPSLDALPPGCAFSDRCPEAMEICRLAEPALAEVGPGHRVRCFLHHDKQRKREKRAA